MQEINPQNFKISCSAISEIMTEPKLKSETLSMTCKSYCKDWLRIQIYEKQKEFTSKYTDKGIQTEDDAIKLLNKFYGWNAEKNSVRKWSEFMHGECDLNIETEDLIVDIKSSYSCFTFPIFEKEIPDKKYMLQIQGYMHLWGMKKGRISYVLMDMPDDMVAKELKWKFPEPPSDEEYQAAAAQYFYSHMADNLRIKSFNFDYNPELIAAIEQRVKDCRIYISSLLDQNLL